MTEEDLIQTISGSQATPRPHQRGDRIKRRLLRCVSPHMAHCLRPRRPVVPAVTERTAEIFRRKGSVIEGHIASLRAI